MNDAIRILPGEISDPDWPGPRCTSCGRIMGGDGMITNCEQYGELNMPVKAHLTFADVKPDVALRWFMPKTWDNALQAVGTLAAIEWFSSPCQHLNGQRPLDVLKRGAGMDVLKAQFSEWPSVESTWRRLQERKRVA